MVWWYGYVELLQKKQFTAHQAEDDEEGDQYTWWVKIIHKDEGGPNRKKGN
jgi:hypothetical protein